MIENVDCVILAGGKSSRMGRNKALLPFGNEESLIKYQYQKMSHIFKNVFISTKDKSDFDIKAHFLYEKDKIFSPLIGIENAFKNSKSEQIFFITTDTPFVKICSIEVLCYFEKKCDIVCACTSGKSHYLIGLWDRSSVSFVTKALENHLYKIGDLVKVMDIGYVYFEDEDEFFNLNTPQDYIKALDLLKEKNGWRRTKN
ncbi:molybdenum cofactor guanylyltransferase MobA [Helicobacter sp. 13S00477-4]|uniref:molybdenum cofactor guanylyltransferase MobA n=1 Tax=Helicobacter sp. 13S00477-4 TaxID=1905759 RepID=UPI000BA7D05D|nr:molybdenum cofactor guanylyltransferase MobA [Helicobacter sp. 13S00477-4]PAF52402.1 hypothetical protein BKH44_02430 [Helicobacter sp. 13S00477-4]